MRVISRAGKRPEITVTMTENESDIKSEGDRNFHDDNSSCTNSESAKDSNNDSSRDSDRD